MLAFLGFTVGLATNAAAAAAAAVPDLRLTRRTVTRKAEYTISMLPTATHLFHFSALTFNAHAVHLDAQRARSTDGHRDLLVHGPLTLALMLHVLGGRVADITYRNYAPLYVDEIMTVCVGGAEDVAGSRVRHVWVDGPDGGLAVKGTATMEDEEAARHE
ncbi:hypothetical protein AAL_08407 [Moelleriella libera RCEF 2490]|uniref:MaoC-like dehydratase n=1 Tax=Moelleriella libera RCEF 2490 TaxID=1081109 RepID=A0A162ID32_9HYPO|nr:hypothetical protein AAL_08407 [Moelleriella libera RCEF 2490]